MKKALALVIAAYLLTALTVSAAATGNFVKSPTVQPLPIAEDTAFEVVTRDNRPVDGEIVVVPANDGNVGKYYIKTVADNTVEAVMWLTPYGDRDRLNDLGSKKSSNRILKALPQNGVESAEELMLLARADIESFDTDFTKWKSIWSDDASAVFEKTKNRDVSVGSLFDIMVVPSQDPAVGTDHTYGISISMDGEELSNFAAVMHFNRFQSWEYIPSEVDHTNGNISFVINSANLSPFAVAVCLPGAGSSGSDGEPTSPQTGETGDFSGRLLCGIVLASVCLVALYGERKLRDRVR